MINQNRVIHVGLRQINYACIASNPIQVPVIRDVSINWHVRMFPKVDSFTYKLKMYLNYEMVLDTVILSSI